MSDPRLAQMIPGIIQPRFDRLLERLADVSGDPAEEATHQVRVAARRLAAALDTFAPVMTLPDACRPGRLRRLERRLGDLRDLDVMTERVRGQMEDTDADAIATLDRVLERLDERREGAIRRAHHAARRPGLRRTLDALAEWLNDPRFTGLATMPAGEVIPDLYLPALARLLLHPGWELRGTPSPDLPGAAVLHDLRWRVKLLRYRVECLEDWFGEDATAWLEELHAIQDALGAWHDDRVLMAWLRDALAPEAVVGRVREHARAALAPWEGWRARYLDPRQRRLMRRVLALGGSAHTHPSGFRTSPDQ